METLFTSSLKKRLQFYIRVNDMVRRRVNLLIFSCTLNVIIVNGVDSQCDTRTTVRIIIKPAIYTHQEEKKRRKVVTTLHFVKQECRKVLRRKLTNYIIRKKVKENPLDEFVKLITSIHFMHADCRLVVFLKWQTWHDFCCLAASYNQITTDIYYVYFFDIM